MPLWAGPKKALHVIDALCRRPGEFLGAFDSFGDDGELQFLRAFDRAAREHRFKRVEMDAGDRRDIELDVVGAKHAEHIERREARSEIVERDGDAAFAIEIENAEYVRNVVDASPPAWFLYDNRQARPL